VPRDGPRLLVQPGLEFLQVREQARALLAGLSWAIGNVVSRAARAPGGLALTVWSATVVPVPLLGLSVAIDGPSAVQHGFSQLGWHGVLSTVYTAGLCSLVGYAIFNRLLSRYPSGQVVPWVLLAPVVAMASSWALLGEAPGPAELAGAVLLVTGVLIAQGTLRIPGSRRPAPAGHDGPGGPAGGEGSAARHEGQPLSVSGGRQGVSRIRSGLNSKVFRPNGCGFHWHQAKCVRGRSWSSPSR
jgi:uncharacterized membrane protein